MDHLFLSLISYEFFFISLRKEGRNNEFVIVIDLFPDGFDIDLPTSLHLGKIASLVFFALDVSLIDHNQRHERQLFPNESNESTVAHLGRCWAHRSPSGRRTPSVYSSKT